MSLTPSYKPHSCLCDSSLAFRAKQVQGSQKPPPCREWIMNNIHLGVPQLICSSSSQLCPNRKQISCSCEEQQLCDLPFQSPRIQDTSATLSAEQYESLLTLSPRFKTDQLQISFPKRICFSLDKFLLYK